MQHFMKIFQKKHGKDLWWAGMKLKHREPTWANSYTYIVIIGEGYRTVPNRRDHIFTVPEDVQVFEQLYL